MKLLGGPDEAMFLKPLDTYTHFKRQMVYKFTMPFLTVCPSSHQDLPHPADPLL